MKNNIVLFVKTKLQERENKNNAQAMAAYMKTSMPFYGVKAPDRRDIIQYVHQNYSIQNQNEYGEVIRALWSQPCREEKYIAIAIARLYPQFLDINVVHVFEHMIRDGAWWDFVDDISIHIIGTIISNDLVRGWALVDSWITDSNMWIRRSAIICQNKFKRKTDQNRLFTFCLLRAKEKEFFIQKAIGWALREYSKVEPQEVHDFLMDNRNQLSNFSYKEAAKRIDKRVLK